MGSYLLESTHRVSLFTGYKEYRTHRKYLAWMGDWRKNKKKEVKLDGIGGVNILVKGDVHRSGKLLPHFGPHFCPSTYNLSHLATT